MNNLLVVAEKVVREAGLMAKEILPRSKVLHHKKFGEPVTEGDIRVEEYVISSLSKQYPNHGFDSEEATYVLKHDLGPALDVVQ